MRRAIGNREWLTGSKIQCYDSLFFLFQNGSHSWPPLDKLIESTFKYSILNFHADIPKSRKAANSAIEDFFYERQFIKANFKDGKNIYINNYYKGESTSVKLKPRINYSTFYKNSSHGGALVFEYSLVNGILEYECYTPIWLFGMWVWKLYFKENPISIFKYLKDGFLIEQEFIQLMNKQNT